MMSSKCAVTLTVRLSNNLHSVRHYQNKLKYLRGCFGSVWSLNGKHLKDREPVNIPDDRDPNQRNHLLHCTQIRN